MGLRLSVWLHSGAECTPSSTSPWSSLAVPLSARLAVLLGSSPAPSGHVHSQWSSVHRSPHLRLSACEEEVTRAPVEQSSDGARAERGVRSGLHIWELLWSPEQRGSHAVIGVSTKNCPLQASGYSVLVGGDSQSWGWELKTNQLWHDGKSTGFYPGKRNSQHFTDSDPSLDIPNQVLLVLDADAGSLGFVVNGSFLGAAFGELPRDVDLFPAVSSVRGGATIRLRYLNGARREPPTLMALCHLSICQNLKKNQCQTETLPLPPFLQHYLSSEMLASGNPRVGAQRSSVLLDDGEEDDAREVLLSVLAQHGQVGLCFYDNKDSTLHFMTDVLDNHELHLVAKVVQEVHPNVLITSAKQERCMTRFLQRLASNPDYKPEVVTYPYVDFGLEVGKQRLLSANLPFLPASASEKDKMSYLSSCISFDSPLMLRSVGALLKCLDRRRVGVELEDSSVGVPILQFHAYTLKGVIKIDSDTYSVLQIFKSELHPSVYKINSGEKEGLSLYGILNRCKCKFGSKLLRQWFLRPTQDLAVLNRRQEVIRFFTSPQNTGFLSTLQSSLRNIRNIPTLLRRMSLSHTKVTDWQSLYKTVYSAVCVRDTVRQLPLSIQLFRDITEGFSDDLQYITALISQVVDFETSLRENRFTVKPNVDPQIDEKKRKMMGLSDFLTDVARRELEHLDPRIPSCCVIYIPLIGFLLSVPRLPGMMEKEDFEIDGLDFMFLSEDRLHYRSQRTKELDDLLGDLHCEIRDMETAIMTQLQSAVLERCGSLYKILELSAELDCLMAMSSASQEYGYIPPKLVRNRKISITNGRHPLLELCSTVFVANSFNSADVKDRVKIITGPNSSGKSIYLKQVGLIVFMALIGSNVPAKEAEIGLVDGIFTRMQSRESVSVGLSTFMIDLNQMAQALNSSTGNSLVLIDEFGKGTNTVDGLSLLAASISFWLQKAPVDTPHVLLATNFHSLLQLGLLPFCEMLSLLTLETALDGSELVFLYQLKEGICRSSYAANIATLAGLPTNLVQRGVEVSELYRTGRPIKRLDKASSDEKTNRCKNIVEMFLQLNLDDKSLDVQRFMKEELLPSAGELLHQGDAFS